jgi:hypothetical protein
VLLNSSETKLKLLGFNQNQINELSKKSEVDTSLLLSGSKRQGGLLMQQQGFLDKG